MSNDNRLRDNVERWLIHENYSFKNVEDENNNFTIRVNDVGSFRIPIEIFEPKKQSGVLVLGGKVYLKNRQTGRYLKLTDSERQKFQNSVKEYCDSIRAVSKIFKEDGKVVVGIYLVLDKVKNFNQQIVLDALGQVTEMSEKTNQFIMKTF